MRPATARREGEQHVTASKRTTDAHGTGRYAEVNGVNLYFETHGAGRPMILLHGGLGSGEMFGPVLPALAERHQVIAVDLQGHGRTADIDRPIDVRLMADDIAALIDHLGLDRPDLVGYSLGGGVALHTAATYPAKVGRLVVASAHVRFDAIDPKLRIRQAQVGAAAAEVMTDTPMSRRSQRVAPRPEDVPRLLDGGRRDGGWMGEGRPKGGHALAILPGLTHYNAAISPLFAAVTLAFLDDRPN